MDCTLRNQTLKPPKFSSRGAAIWRDTPLWPQQAAVCGGAAADGLYSLQACATVMHDGDSAWNKAKLMVGMPGAVGNIVCTMSGAGTQLRDGKVVLSSDDLRNSTSKPDVALVLNGSCSAVAFRNMTFVGASFKCYVSISFLVKSFMKEATTDVVHEVVRFLLCTNVLHLLPPHFIGPHPMVECVRCWLEPGRGGGRVCSVPLPGTHT